MSGAGDGAGDGARDGAGDGVGDGVGDGAGDGAEYGLGDGVGDVSRLMSSPFANSREEGFPSTRDTQIMHLQGAALQEKLKRIEEDIDVANTILRLNQPIKTLLTARPPRDAVSQVESMMWDGYI